MWFSGLGKLFSAYYYAKALSRAAICKYIYIFSLRSIGRGCLFFGFPRFGSFCQNISIGKRVMFGEHVFLSASQDASLEIGDGCSLNTGCLVVAKYGIRIGKGTRIGEYTSIRDQNHNFEEASRSVSEQGFVGSQISIGSNCWIGRGVFIGPGVEIGEGAIVGANSVVVKNVPAFAVVAGVPAKVIRFRVTGQMKGLDTRN